MKSLVKKRKGAYYSRTGGVSPFMYDVPEISEDIPEIGEQVDYSAYQTDLGGVSAEGQMTDPEDDDRFKKAKNKVKEDLEWVQEFQDYSTEDIIEELSYENRDGEKIYINFDNVEEQINKGAGKTNWSEFLGDSYELRTRFIGRDEYGQIGIQQFDFGNITHKKNKDGDRVQTINITAKNHPLYGNTYTRTEIYPNPDYESSQPINELKELLNSKNYKSNDGEYSRTFDQYIDAFVGPRIQGDGSAAWNKSDHQSLMYFIDNIENIDEKEKQELKIKVEDLFYRFKEKRIWKTVLNK